MQKKEHIFLRSCAFILIACSTMLHTESPKQPEALCALARECVEAQMKIQNWRPQIALWNEILKSRA